MLDVLLGRLKVFAQFDYEKFFEIAHRETNLKFSFITGKPARRIKAARMSKPLIE